MKMSISLANVHYVGLYNNGRRVPETSVLNRTTKPQ